MITLDRASYFKLAINGTSVELAGVKLSYAAIRSHVKFSLPTLELELIDFNGQLAEFNIRTGTKLDVVIDRLKETNRASVKFVVFNCTPSSPKENGSTGIQYNISAYYDFHDFLYKRESKVYKNKTSSDVFSEIVTTSPSLKAVIDTSSDSKIWRQTAKTPAEFIRKDLLPYSYNGDESYYQFGISAIKQEAYFRDIAKLLQGEPKFKLINAAVGLDKVYDGLIDEFEFRADTGFMNKVAYGLKTMAYDVTTSLNKTFSEVKITKVGEKLPVDSNLLQEAKRVFGSLEIGNTEPSHYESYTRNLRSESLYSIELDVLLRHESVIDLFDLVDINILQRYHNPNRDERISGKYICVGKAVAVTELEYVERLCFVSNSENLKQDSGLKS